MSNQDELNDARFISRDEIPNDEEVDTNACIISDVSTIASDISDEEPYVIYTEEDIIQAQQFGVSVEELFKIYEEINNYDDDEYDHCNCEEWPNWNDRGYEDEGVAESMY